MNREVSKLIWACWLPIAKNAARAYVAGPELADGLGVCKELSENGYGGTLCFWNGDGDSSRQIADKYLAAVEAIAASRLDCQLSVKAPPIGFSSDLVMEIAARARQLSVPMHFDSLGPEAADQTFALILKTLPIHSMLGCTLPARWRRSLRDADLAVDQGLKVRVVKGQWSDLEQSDIDPRDGFLAVIDRLAGRARHVAVATHDPSLARQALGRLRAAGTSCELELLFGLPLKDALCAARQEGAPVRFYVPYGHAWLPYCLSQCQQNPRIFWWVLRDLVVGHPFRPGGGSPS